MYSNDLSFLHVRLKCSRINLSAWDGYFSRMYARRHFWYEKSIQTPSVRTTKRHLDFLNSGCLSTFKENPSYENQLHIQFWITSIDLNFPVKFVASILQSTLNHSKVITHEGTMCAVLFLRASLYPAQKLHNTVYKHITLWLRKQFHFMEGII